MKKLALKVQQKRRKGFTLVELIVVIAILAILSVGAIVGYGRVRDSANDAVSRANASVIVRSLNTYNALATNGGTTAKPADAAALNALLNLSADNGIIAIDLRVDATPEEINEALPFVSYDTASGRFVVLDPA